MPVGEGFIPPGHFPSAVHGPGRHICRPYRLFWAARRGRIYASRQVCGCRILHGRDKSLPYDLSCPRFTAAYVGGGVLDAPRADASIRPYGVGVDARHRPGKLPLPHTCPGGIYAAPTSRFGVVRRGRIYAARVYGRRAFTIYAAGRACPAPTGALPFTVLPASRLPARTGR